jgi:hypothetical protein
MTIELDEQRCIVAYLNGLQAKVNALREPHKGVILQVKGGEELYPRTIYEFMEVIS